MISMLVVVADDGQDEISRLIDDAGPVAGLFVLVLGIVVFLLWRSMTRQLKRIDPTLATGPDDAEQELDRELTAEAVERGAAAEQAEGPGTDESPDP